MKARVKNTGEIVEINESSTIYDAALCHIYKASELESVLDTPDYWTRLEHTYAGMAMQGILANSAFNDSSVADIAITSIKVATSLITRLKEERK